MAAGAFLKRYVMWLKMMSKTCDVISSDIMVCFIKRKIIITLL